ncbi:hypothetical protein [Prevotella pallens]|uniref:hypothetical protein n=1 Tax=Prevotella pallens TaxID=60133 RepID=UPI001CAB9E3F|nr:hypothetical protein [Prevotella pallens]MBF1517859.1 hypothetical protein [Prevotella pallens]
MDKLNLRQAMEKLHELGIEVECGGFGSFEDFISYYDAHYYPLLEQLSKEWSMEGGPKRFIADDMLKFFVE